MILLFILTFAVIAGIEIPSLVRRKLKKELICFILFLGASFILTILMTAGVKLPDPVDGIKAVLDLLHWHF